MLEKEKLEKAIEEITEIFDRSRKLSNFDLLEICKKEGIESIASENDNHLAHELVEVALNNYISKKYCRNIRLDDLKKFRNSCRT